MENVPDLFGDKYVDYIIYLQYWNTKLLKLLLFVFLYFLVLIQTEKVPQLMFSKTAKLGDNVTLHCEVLNEYKFILYWYKQSLGFIPRSGC